MKTFSLSDYDRIAEKFYETNTKKGFGETRVPFHTEWAIDRHSGKFIFELLLDMRPEQTLEVGLAQGASTLHFLMALNINNKGSHTAMDPLQGGFSDVGLAEMTRLGIIDRLRFFRERSDIVLPELRKNKEVFQVCLIDGDHRFDAVFTDFYCIDKILEIEGIIIFDEAGSGPTDKVISFIKNNLKNYEIVTNVPKRFHAIKKMDIDRRDWSDMFNF